MSGCTTFITEPHRRDPPSPAHRGRSPLNLPHRLKRCSYLVVRIGEQSFRCLREDRCPRWPRDRRDSQRPTSPRQAADAANAVWKWRGPDEISTCPENPSSLRGTGRWRGAGGGMGGAWQSPGRRQSSTKHESSFVEMQIRLNEMLGATGVRYGQGRAGQGWPGQGGSRRRRVPAIRDKMGGSAKQCQAEKWKAVAERGSRAWPSRTATHASGGRAAISQTVNDG